MKIQKIWDFKNFETEIAQKLNDRESKGCSTSEEMVLENEKSIEKNVANSLIKKVNAKAD